MYINRYIYHILFIHSSSVNEHLGCFYLLSNVNNAFMKTEVETFNFFPHGNLQIPTWKSDKK